jgi:hypothetical protein
VQRNRFVVPEIEVRLGCREPRIEDWLGDREGRSIMQYAGDLFQRSGRH